MQGRWVKHLGPHDKTLIGARTPQLLATYTAGSLRVPSRSHSPGGRHQLQPLDEKTRPQEWEGLLPARMCWSWDSKPALPCVKVCALTHCTMLDRGARSEERCGGSEVSSPQPLQKAGTFPQASPCTTAVQIITCAGAQARPVLAPSAPLLPPSGFVQPSPLSLRHPSSPPLCASVTFPAIIPHHSSQAQDEILLRCDLK